MAHKIHLSMADNDKRLKNAEILLSHTAFRLNEMLHASSFEDRPLVEQTLDRGQPGAERGHDAGLPQITLNPLPPSPETPRPPSPQPFLMPNPFPLSAHCA